jgi:hypothetical protein
MEQEKQPVGLLFGSIGYNKPEDVDSLIDNLDIAQSFYMITQSLHYVHESRLLTLLVASLIIFFFISLT